MNSYTKDLPEIKYFLCNVDLMMMDASQFDRQGNKQFRLRPHSHWTHRRNIAGKTGKKYAITYKCHKYGTLEIERWMNHRAKVITDIVSRKLTHRSYLPTKVDHHLRLPHHSHPSRLPEMAFSSWSQILACI